MPLVAAPTGGARTLTELYGSQVPQMRQQGISLKLGALETLRNKRQEIIARLEKIKQERAQKKAEREARRKRYLTAGIGIGATVLGAGVGGIGAAGVGSGLTGLQGAALGAGLGASAGSGFGQLAAGDPRGGQTLANTAFTAFDRFPKNAFFDGPSEPTAAPLVGSGAGQW